MAKIGLRAYNREIEQLIERGQIEEAIAHCKYILRFYPKHIETYRLLGKAYIESQRYSEGADILQRILSVLPDDFVSQIGMSIIREDEGNLDAAIFHMERAHEIQPSNVAVQDELRRLYGRRDGIEPPRLRLTRGALVRLYAKGDLYRQAIAEIRAALAEDPNRFDLEVILARMYHLQGQKVEATEVASRLVTKLPYCFEANRVLADVLPSTSRAEDAKIYQQRVFVLDPYLAYISPNAPTSNLVPDNAVTLDRLDWQPTAAGEEQPAWAQNAGVSFEAEAEAETTPEWLSSPSEAKQTLEAAPEIERLPSAAAVPSEIPSVGENEIPEWMQEAGWGAATHPGAETAPAENAEEEAAIVPGEIPDWLKGMAPSSEIAAGTEEENKLEWLDQILPAAETTEAVAAVAGAEEAPVSEEISPESESLASETQLPAEAEVEPVEALPEWLTFPEAEAPVAEMTTTETAQIEKVIEGVPAQELKEAVPTEELAEVVSTQELNEVAPTEEVSEAVPTDEVPEGIPTEELREAAPFEEVAEVASSEEFAQIVPTTEVTEAVPTEELAEAVNTEELAEPLPTVEVTEAIPTEVLTEALPTTEVTEAVPTEELAEAIPTKEFPEPLPTEEVTKAIPTEEFTEALPTTEVTEAIPTEELAEAIPTEELAEAVPTEEVTEAVPTGELVEVVPTTEMSEAAPTEELAETVPTEEMAETAPAQEVPAAFPEEEIEFIPAETEVQEIIQPQEVETAEVPAAESEAIAETPVEEKTQPIRIAPAQTQVPVPEAEILAPETAGMAQVEELQPEAPVAETVEEVSAIAKTEQPPALTTEGSTAQPEMNDIDAAMAWLESLAAKQGAEEETLFTSTEERLATPPDWVSEELAKAQAEGVGEVAEEGVKVVEEPATELPTEIAAENISEIGQPAVGEMAAEMPVETTEVEIPPQAARFEGEEVVSELPVEPSEETASSAVDETIAELPTAPEVESGLLVDQYTTSGKKTAPLGETKAAGVPEEMDDEAAFAWLESLAANQGADEGTLITPESERSTTAPAWVLEQAAEGNLTDASDLLEGSLAVAEPEKTELEEVSPAAAESELEFPQVAEAPTSENIVVPETPVTPVEPGEWMKAPQETHEPESIAFEEPAAASETPTPESEEPLPSWLQEFEPISETPVKEVAVASEEDLPDWLKGFEAPAEAPISQASDESISVKTWLNQHETAQQAQAGANEAAAAEVQAPESISSEPPASEPAGSFLSESASPEEISISSDPLLAQAQIDLKNGKIESAVNTFNQLIEQGQHLDEIIQNLQGSLYVYPVEISLWQTLGDAFMRGNRIQEALDAYTKAEDLLK